MAMLPPFGLLVRHQFGAVLATALDFALMILLVQGAGAAPALATGVGAFAGAVANFALGRRWIFRRTDGALLSQAVRYACVSFGSLLLNVMLEQFACTVLGENYLPSRIVVAAVVGILWNFPLHRRFVFAVRA